jgi:hypothetical protein
VASNVYGCLFGARDEFHLAAILQNLKTMGLRLLGPSLDLASDHMRAFRR